jgi:hypothetical protein
MSTRREGREAGRRSALTSKPVTECIAENDLDYHQRVFNEFREAIEAEQQAARRAEHARAAFQSWATHLHDRYKLDPERGEGVKEDGTIDRAPEDV